MNLNEWRNEYDKYKLNEDSLPFNPFLLFKKWIEEATKDNNPEPNAMTLTTCSNQEASSRIVLLKEIEEEQFIFYTNYNSSKAIDISLNPKVSLLFFWPYSQRQIRIKGSARKTSREKAIEYFNTRPLESRISAIASPQSKKIEKSELIKMTEDVVNSGDFFCPEHWGGYSVLANEIEFWQGQPARLHDRIIYKKTNENNWEIYRLAP